MAIVYRKTAKGLNEIETRAHRLVPRLRSALIVVDGRRSDEELAKMMLQDPAGTLQALLEGGFIEAIGTVTTAVERAAAIAAASAAAAAAAAATPAPARSAPSFEQSRRDAVRHLTDLVGPVAEALAIRMERSRNPGELRTLLVVAMQIIANTRGRQAAADYGRRFGIDAGG